MNILFYAEYDHEQNDLTQSSKAALNACLLLQQKLGAKAIIDALLFTKTAPIIASINFKPIHKVIFAINNKASPATFAAIAANYDYIIACNNSNGKNMLPLLCAAFNSCQLSDITEIIDKDIFKRPIYTGNALATVKINSPKILLTIRQSAFSDAIEPKQLHETILEEASIVTNEHIIEPLLCCELEHNQNDIDLQNAPIVIAGGRALQSSENFMNILEPLANKLAAAIGATRAAVDAGFAPNDWQIGQTGKIIAPKLYIAIGLSGAQQHIMGIKDAQNIIAINIEAEEPIVKIADYALIGDLFKIVPELNEKLK